MRHSLRLRLLLVAALTIVVSLGVAGMALTALFQQHIEREAVRRLTDDLNRLAALVDADQPKIVLTQRMADPRFDVPYGGIYWQVRDTAAGEIARSRSMWDKTFELPAPSGSSSAPAELRVSDPEGAAALALVRTLAFELDGGALRSLELVVAEDTSAMDAAVADYRLELFKALVILAIILVLSAWAQVTLGLSPLKAIQRGINAIRTGEAPALEGDFPLEVQPLVSEVNDLTRAQELAIQFARERAADLAHGLKGQLQVLNAQAHDLRVRGEAGSADALEGLTAEMAATIDHQLGLSRLRRRSPHRAAGTPLIGSVDKIVRTLKNTERGAEIVWKVDVAADALVSLDPSDLRELLGALIENAAKWAKSEIRIVGQKDGASCRFAVEDDGPGLTDAQIERLGQRGVRLDEARSGSGIGISIVREIVALNGGELVFARSSPGGLMAQVRLPAGQIPH